MPDCKIFRQIHARFHCSDRSLARTNAATHRPPKVARVQSNSCRVLSKAISTPLAGTGERAVRQGRRDQVGSSAALRSWQVPARQVAPGSVMMLQVESKPDLAVSMRRSSAWRRASAWSGALAVAAVEYARKPSGPPQARAPIAKVLHWAGSLQGALPTRVRIWTSSVAALPPWVAGAC